jgi:hypothetical protein
VSNAKVTDDVTPERARESTPQAELDPSRFMEGRPGLVGVEDRPRRASAGVAAMSSIDRAGALASNEHDQTPPQRARQVGLRSEPT